METPERAQEEVNGESLPEAAEAAVIYPPKYVHETSHSAVWLRSLSSLALYLVIGYYIFKTWEILLLITAIVVIHEMGHFLAMKFYRYKDLGIFFIPLLGAYVSGSKREVSQKESAVILLAGPLPGILIGIIFYLLGKENPLLFIGHIPYERVALFFVILNLFNLIPVYPLDGGQLLNRVFFNEENWLSRLFVFLSIALLAWFAWKSHFPVLFIFPLLVLLRFIGDSRAGNIEKRIEGEGINTDVDYEDLPDRDYWKIRNILIDEHPAYRGIPPAPPFTYAEREEKIMTTIQGLLHRHLLQDISLGGKLFVLLVWIAAMASPWLVDMDMSFFRRLGI